MNNISVVIPFYNSENILDRCITSCINQTLKPRRIICVNDESTDGTLKLLNKYADEYNHIIVIDKKNGGICSARNAGLDYVDTEYVAFLDHDDVMQPNKLKHQYRLIESSGRQYGFVASSYIDVLDDQAGRKIYRRVNDKDLWVSLIHAQLGRTSSNLWRVKDILSAGGWMLSDGLSLDTGLMFRLMKHGVHPILDDTVHTTRYITASSASRSNRIKQWSTFFDLRVDIFHFLKAEGLLTEAREEALCIDWIIALRGLYARDHAMAGRLSEKLPLPPQKMSKYGIGPGRMYRYLYRYLGFVWAERLQGSLSAMRALYEPVKKELQGLFRMLDAKKIYL